MGFKLGICMWGFPMQGPEGLEKASEMGFKGAAISLDSFGQQPLLTDARIQKQYREAARLSGIEIAAVSVESLNQYGLSNPSETKKSRIAMEECRRGIDAAAELGVKVVQLPSFNDGAIKNEDDYKYTFEKILQLCEMVKGSEILIGTENVLSIEGSRRMLEEAGSNQLKIIFDTQNYNLVDGFCAAEHFRELYPYIEQIHVKDGTDGKISSALLTSGDSGFLETAEAINEKEGCQWILLENYFNQKPLNELYINPFDAVQTDIETVKGVFQL